MAHQHKPSPELICRSSQKPRHIEKSFVAVTECRYILGDVEGQVVGDYIGFTAEIQIGRERC